MTVSLGDIVAVVNVSLRFDQATARDVDAIVDLVQTAYRGEESRAGWTTEADLVDGRRTDAEDVETLRSELGSCFVLARRRGELVASVLLRVNGEQADIGMFAVRPTEQGRGIGSQLLAHVESVAAGAGATLARIRVIEQRQDVIAWYAARGYGSTGEAEPFPYGQPRFGEPRRDDLWFTVMTKQLVGNDAPA